MRLFIGIMVLLITSYAKGANNQAQGDCKSQFTTPILNTIPSCIGDDIGKGLAIHGDLLVVGAPDADSDGTSSGSVTTYRKVNGDWLYEQTLTPPAELEPYDDFGQTIATDGNSIIVGQPNGESGYNGYGWAAIYNWNGSDWTLAQFCDPAVIGYGTYKGRDVDIDGEWAILGSPGADVNDLDRAGSAHIYRRSGNNWNLHTTLNNPNPQAGAWFGFSTSLSGNTVAIGAIRQNSSDGSVYIYRFDGGNWYLSQTINGQNQLGDQFGECIDLEDNLLAIGAPRDDTTGSNDGALYVYESVNGGQFSQSAKLYDSGGYYLGSQGISINGNRITVSEGYTFSTGNDVWIASNESGKWSLELFPDSPGSILEVAWAEDTIAIGSSSGCDGGSVSVWNEVVNNWSFQELLCCPNPDFGGGNFGDTLHIHQDFLFVEGTTGREVEIYERGSSGWTLLQRIETTSSIGDIATHGPWLAMDASPGIYKFNGEIYEAFGSTDLRSADSLALTESELIAGDYSATVDAIGYAGLARRYVLTTNEDSSQEWLYMDEISPANPYWQRTFGYSVAIENDWMFISALRGDTYGYYPDIPSVYCYQRIDSNWNLQQVIYSPDTDDYVDEDDDSFGSGIATEGTTLVIGAKGFYSTAGRLHIYELNADHNWTLDRSIDAPVGTSSRAYFGEQVYIENNRLVSGAKYYYGGDLFNSTAVVCEPVDGTWQITELLAPTYEPDGYLDTVFLAGNTLVINDWYSTGGEPLQVHIGYLQGFSADCNGNGICDGEELASGTSRDCDHNGVPDSCQINSDSSLDCNVNGELDSCEADLGLVADCNGNGTPDSCDIADGTASDCNGNGTPDSCDIADGLPDCNSNGVPDICEDIIKDCNGNGISDACDIASGTSPDTDSDGIPDECDPNFIITVGNDGNSLFNQIQPAIELALPGAIIEVGPGSYEGCIVFPDHGIQLISQDGPEATIITGDDDGKSIIQINETHTSETLLQGFTIRDGFASSGGGLFIDRSTPTIRNCTFLNNSASGLGGAVLIDRGSPRFENCRFLGNQAEDGGAISVYDEHVSGIAIELSNCLLQSNTANEGRGGGIFANLSTLSITGTTFDGNSASDLGGGIHVQNNDTLLVDECTFTSNRSDQAGGAMSHVGSAPPFSIARSFFCLNTPDDIYGSWNDIDSNTFAEDCDGDGVCDGEQIEADPTSDCNGNGLIDSCEIGDELSSDCNFNGIPDQCDIADGTSDDLNENGIPDECLICEFQSTITFNNYGTSNGLDIVIDGNIAAIVCNTNGSTDDDLEVQFFKLNGTSWLHEATLPLPQASAIYYPRKPIAISGDYAIAGFASVFDPFPVAIYHRNNGDWIQQASLQPPASSQYFALSVDISGDTAVVGSPTDSDGQALVYRSAGDYWYLEATLIQPGDQESAYFASEVAIDGDTLLVGSLAEGAWAFERSGTTWSFVERIQSETDNSIGCSIDLDGDVAVMGSYERSPERTIVVFRRDSTGHWMEEQELTTTIPDSPPLGFDVRISGDTILTNSGLDFNVSGARDSGTEVLLAETTNSIRGDDDGLNSPGNVHLFRYENGFWSETRVFSRPDLPDAQINSPFVGLSGDLALYAFVDNGGYQFSGIDWFTTTISNEESGVDCNDNQICDEVDLILGTSGDCDGNGTLDDCDIENGVYADVDLDGIPDVCESDCNGNLVPDDLELEQGLELDCNGNGVPDSCDISNGLSPDEDSDGIPDECDSNYIINVSADGSGLFTDLQDAMNLVLPGGTIQVTAGMYGPISLPAHSVTLVSIDGAQSTFIEGGDGQSALTIVHGDHDDTVVDGFTLMNGQAVGGGLLISGSNPTIRNCFITMNESPMIGGGGLVLSAAPVFENCQFVSNSATFGGGGLAIVGTATDGEPCVIDDCLFEANIVTDEGTGLTDSARGGGLFASEANVDVLDSRFILNTAPSLGGGLDLSSSTSMHVSDTVFLGNDTGFRGRSISSFYNTPGPEPELSGNSFCQNDGNGIESDYIFGNWIDLGDNLFGSDCDADGVCDFDQSDDDCNGNGVLDSCDIASGTEEDCNGNGIPDWCDINVYGTSVDFNQNGVPDECKPDCNGNNVPDYLDISFGNSLDCDGNGIPDECEDCNNNGIGDNCDIADGTSEDLNSNGIPDECDIDCDGDGVPDDYEIDQGTEQDCNNNGIPDWCDINVFSTSFDCNGNTVPDSCDIEFGDSGDCNSNGTPDECDIAVGVSQDCNGNGVPDECDIADGTALDCNHNGTPDTCESDYVDCNKNGVRDDCEIENGISNDCNENGVPDICDFDEGLLSDCNTNDIYDECEESYADCQPNGIADFCDIAGGSSNDLNQNGLPDECEPDCNENGFPDFIDIAFGNSADENDNGIPDECECPDVNGDGFVDVNDLLMVIEQFGNDCRDGGCTADISGPGGEPDGFVDVNDILAIIGSWSCVASP